MNEQQTKAMLSDIICEVDYDIWKEMYNPDTAEEPELVVENYSRLTRIVRDHFDNLMMSAEQSCRGGGESKICGIYDCSISHCSHCEGFIIRGVVNKKETKEE